MIFTVVNLPLALIILVKVISEVPFDLDEAAGTDGGTNSCSG